MKQFLIFALTIGLGQTALAETEANQQALRLSAAQESKWQAVDINVPGLRGEIKGFLTGDKQIRLDYLDGVIQSDAQLTSAEFKRYSGKAQYLKECNANISIFPSLRALKIPYQLTMPVLNANSVPSLVPTQLRIEYFQVQINATSDALLFQSGDLDIHKLEQDILFQLNRNKKQIEDSGLVAIDLAGLDDVVCDLIAGSAAINVQTRIHYDAPKLKRTPRLDAEDVRSLSDDIQRGWVSAKEPKRNLVLGSVRLGRALEKRQGVMQALEDWEVAHLHDLFFDPTQFDILKLTTADYSKIVVDMSWLSKGLTYSTPIYHTSVISPLEGN